MKKAFIYLFILIFNVSFSQEYKLGKVTIDELKETEHKLEKEAVACKLFSKAKTQIVYSDNKGFELITEVENKIKIYKAEGLKYANFGIEFYNFNSDKETVDFSDAITYNLVNNKIEKTKLKSEGEFVEKKNKYYSERKITMPNVKSGSIIEFKYTLRSPFLSRINEWYFQDLIPVNYSNYQFLYPEYYSYNPFYKGGLDVKTTKRIESKTLVFASKERQNDGLSIKTNFSETKLTYNENIINYEILNVPSIQNESNVKNISNYISSVSHELASIKYPNEPYKLLSTTWDEVAKTINNSESFGGELGKKGYFEEEINKVISDKNSNDEKLMSIFNYVKTNFKWNGYYGIYTDEGLKSVFKNKIGNVADINLLLTNFLRHAGLNAHPVLISSVSNGIPLFPSRTAFNYVVAGVELDGKTILLDATDKYTVPNILPSRAINWNGRMIYQNGGSKEVDLEPNIPSKDNIIMNFSVSADGKAQGSIKRQLTNYNAYYYRSNYGSLTNESLVETKEKSLNNIQINNYKNENINDLNLAVIESFDFVDDKNVEIIGDKIYLSPLLFYVMDSNPFKSDERKYPVEFPFPFTDKYMITINLPEGYEVESFPQTENLYFADKILSHKYIISNEGNVLKLMLQEDVNVTILTSEYYTDLKEYYQKKLNKQNEKIVLKKK